MAFLGQINRLRVVKFVDFGLYLDGGDLGEILLPKRYVPEDVRVGDALEVFVYLDSEDLPIATTETPKITVGKCAVLKVVAVNKVGAFLDWGLMKDLMVPYGEQVGRMKVGESHLVTAYIDDRQGKITASAKLDKHLSEKSIYHKPGQMVEMIIAAQTPLGYKAVVDQHFFGLLYNDEAPRPLKVGQKITGFIKTVREDGKIDLSLRKTPPAQVYDSLSTAILKHLEENGGRSHITDKSSPGEIHDVYGVSKSSYKKAIGHLYKLKKIKLSKEEITLL